MKMKTRHDYPILLLALIAGLMGFTTGATWAQDTRRPTANGYISGYRLCCGQEEVSDTYRFSNGTMKLNVNPVTKEVEVLLVNGKIRTMSENNNAGDSKEHIFSISYKEKITE
ncbi:hypothetical protein TFKS16_2580 [Tannerella forsythia KS16]|jgi:hypothetical protein|uniref:Uncharacterized protein n=2 Tax=Tannerella forsythia TaxID=28112 RepID=A0A1D3UVW5_TANFO|nr:hypothetical protein [Tannerella forsythia]BAR49936.1 hypothetical protein TF3313_2503 [Tannerella forsythia 3313]BAR52763.1 hypothetical protein TFKS16_2580 [Tannerella forsythia KS16]SCQ24163.1 hypothetical protein TFUB20_02339 [Tannerella forsythia]